MKVFDNNYTLWYHKSICDEWGIDSYDKIFDINNSYDIDILNEYNNQKILLNGMFFLMKDKIEPIWENEQNKNGGYLSFKVPSKVIYDVWNIIIYHTLTNSLVLNNEIYNGFSLAPKKKFCIVKLWFSQPIDKNNIMKLNDSRLNIKNALFKRYN